MSSFESAVSKIIQRFHFTFEHVKKCWLFMKPNDTGLHLPSEICAKIRMFYAPPSYLDLPFVTDEKGRHVYSFPTSKAIVDNKNRVVYFYADTLCYMFTYRYDRMCAQAIFEVEPTSGVAIRTDLSSYGTPKNLATFFDSELHIYLNDPASKSSVAFLAKFNPSEIAKKLKRRGFVDPVRFIDFTTPVHGPSLNKKFWCVNIGHTMDRKHVTNVSLYRTDEEGIVVYRIHNGRPGIDEVIKIIMPMIEALF